MAELETPASPPAFKILSPSYLEKAGNRRELVARLDKVVSVLRDDENVEPDSPDYPGLAALAESLVEKFLNHKDKEIRLYSVLCCMELFAVYAPEAPWSEEQIYNIFQQTIRQLANLAHTTSPQQAHYKQYMRILDLLATVKIGVVLVDLARNSASYLVDDMQSEGRENPLELLQELFKTVLQSLRREHPAQVLELAQKTITGCLEEYHSMVPLPLVEELLICVEQPTIWVTIPGEPENNKRGKQSSRPPKPKQLEVTNPSYVAAATIIRKNVNALSSPVANLLDGVINGDPQIVEKSSIVSDVEDAENHNQGGADVWTIVYEIGRISSPILTTVIGTVSACLSSEELRKREQSVKLLGKLFSARGSKLATKFAPCFRDFLRRSKDTELSIRKFMSSCLVSIIRNIPDSGVAEECDTTLSHILEKEPKVEVRLVAINEICDFVYESNADCPVSEKVLQAVGIQVKSKSQQERMAAITGLAQIFFRHYVQPVVQGLHDEVDIKVVSETVAKNCFNSPIGSADHPDQRDSGTSRGKYRFIAGLIFRCLKYSDNDDSVMRSRVIQIIDDALLGSDTSKNIEKRLNPTARAVGLLVIVDALRDDSAFDWMVKFFKQRAMLQRQLGRYIDERSKTRRFERGSEENIAADAVAMEKLRNVAIMIPIPDGLTVDDLIEKLHLAKDKHIFRILSALADPKNGKSTRTRALDELPRRTKSLGDPVSEWARGLVRRCSMGHFLNADVVDRCISLAKESSDFNVLSVSAGFLSCAKLAIEIFPSLSKAQTMITLKEMCLACCEITSSSKQSGAKKQAQNSDIIESLCSVLTLVCRSLKNQEDGTITGKPSEDKKLRRQLLHVCVEGSTGQARQAVQALGTVFSSSNSTIESGGITAEAMTTTILKELTSPMKMKIDGKHILGILSALAALSEIAPGLFTGSRRGETAVRFALDSILLGRSRAVDKDVSSEDESTDDEQSPAKHKRGRKSKTPKSFDSELSFASRRLCAAVEFLVSYVRFAILSSSSGQHSPPPREQIKTLFNSLTQILRDKGSPPSNRDRKCCRFTMDRAAIRKCVGVQLLVLCDQRLRLHETYLSPSSWQTLSTILMDEEKFVRSAAITQFIDLMTGNGVFRSAGTPMAPSLRFLALVVFCADESNVAAHIGKMSLLAKTAAQKCVTSMRKTCHDALASQNLKEGGLGSSLEKAKIFLMPEYAVPYAFHLLAFRNESPFMEATTVSKSSRQGLSGRKSSSTNDSKLGEPPALKLLKRRLKLLLDPIVHSLGDGADNISFLLEMTAALSSCFPIDVSGSKSRKWSPVSSPLSDESKSVEGHYTDQSQKKLKVICSVAREILLSYVKKDVNLSDYPGQVMFPTDLFKHLHKQRRLDSQSVSPKEHESLKGRNRLSENIRSGGSPPETIVGLSPNVSPIAKVDEDDATTSGVDTPDKEMEITSSTGARDSSKENPGLQMKRSSSRAGGKKRPLGATNNRSTRSRRTL